MLRRILATVGLFFVLLVSAQAADVGPRRALLGGKSPSIASYLASKGLTGSNAGASFQDGRYWLPVLGSELENPTGFTLGTSATNNGAGQITQPSGTGSYTYQVVPTVVGRAYRVAFRVTSGTIFSGVWQNGPTNTVISSIGSTTSGSYTYAFVAPASTATFSFTANVGTGVIDNISVQELTNAPRFSTQAEFFSAFTASSTTARTYVNANGVLSNNLAGNQPRFTWSGGRQWLYLENAITNKCTNYNASPPALVAMGTAAAFNAAGTGMTASGDAATLYGVVDDTAALAAGLGSIGNGRVYKIDNSAGVTASSLTVPGATGNTNQHAVSAYIRGSGSTSVELNGLSPAAVPVSSAYARMSNVGTPSSAGNLLRVRATAGSVVYFTLNQLEEQTFASAVIPTAGAAATRAIETMQLNPIMTALLQREGMVLVRGKLESGAAVSRILGGPTTFAQMNSGTVAATASSFNGTLNLQKAVSSNWVLSNFALAVGFSASGRSVTGNGLVPSTDANIFGDISTAYLARGGTVSAAVAPYADGFYNTIALFPTRNDATMPALSTPNW